MFANDEDAERSLRRSRAEWKARRQYDHASERRRTVAENRQAALFFEEQLQFPVSARKESIRMRRQQQPEDVGQDEFACADVHHTATGVPEKYIGADEFGPGYGASSNKKTLEEKRAARDRLVGRVHALEGLAATPTVDDIEQEKNRLENLDAARRRGSTTLRQSEAVASRSLTVPTVDKSRLFPPLRQKLMPMPAAVVSVAQPTAPPAPDGGTTSRTVVLNATSITPRGGGALSSFLATGKDDGAGGASPAREVVPSGSNSNSAASSVFFSQRPRRGSIGAGGGGDPLDIASPTKSNLNASGRRQLGASVQFSEDVGGAAPAGIGNFLLGASQTAIGGAQPQAPLSARTAAPSVLQKLLTPLPQQQQQQRSLSPMAPTPTPRPNLDELFAQARSNLKGAPVAAVAVQHPQWHRHANQHAHSQQQQQQHAQAHANNSRLGSRRPSFTTLDASMQPQGSAGGIPPSSSAHDIGAVTSVASMTSSGSLAQPVSSRVAMSNDASVSFGSYRTARQALRAAGIGSIGTGGASALNPMIVTTGAPASGGIGNAPAGTADNGAHRRNAGGGALKLTITAASAQA